MMTSTRVMALLIWTGLITVVTAADDKIIWKDVMFLLDSSSGVTEDDFAEMKNFAIRMVNKVSANINNGGVRIGVIVYGNPAYTIQYAWKRHQTSEKVKAAINGTQYHKMGRSNPEPGLYQVNAMGPDVDRSGVSNLVFVISGAPFSHKGNEARIAKASGTQIYAVAIGRTNITAVHKMVSTPAEENSIEVSTFDDLQKFPVAIFERLIGKYTDHRIRKDVVFLLDSSKSVTEENFNKMKDFANTIVEKVNTGVDGVRIGALVYSRNANAQFHLNTYKANFEIREAINAMPYTPGPANTAAAFELAYDEMFTTANGDRPDVDDLAFIITDGPANYNQSGTLPAAQRLKDKGVRISAMAIGWSGTRELHAMVSTPTAKNSFETTFDRLQNFPVQLLEELMGRHDCGPPPGVNREIIHRMGNVEIYSCDSGYHLIGESTLTCLADGKWNGTTPTCSPCGPPPVIVSGTFHRIVNVAVYSCDSGYHLIGESTLTCQADGKWNGTTPMCVDNSPIIVENSTESGSRCKAGQTQLDPCPTGYGGIISRTCNTYGEFETAIKNCTKQDILSIYDDVVSSNTSDVTAVLEKLVNITSSSSAQLQEGDIQTLHGILSHLTPTIGAGPNEVVKNTDNFLSIANTLLDENNTHTWTRVSHMAGYGAEAVLGDIDTFVEKTANLSGSNITSQTIAKSNIFLTVRASNDCRSSIDFPNRSESDEDIPDRSENDDDDDDDDDDDEPNRSDSGDEVPQWVKTSVNRIQAPCSKEVGLLVYSAAMYKNISGMIRSRLSGDSSTDNSSRTVNSEVISMSFYPPVKGPLTSPVTITFQALNNSLEGPKCSYWKFDNTGESPTARGGWASDGCWLHSYTPDTGIAVCKCNHLTNFGLLMSPAGQVQNEVHSTVLSTISLVGCIISIVALAVTIIVYGIYWRYVRGDRALIKVSLCVALIIAYVTFLAGVTRTGNKVGCAVVAVLLHYTFLLVFLLMLTESLQTAYTILRMVKPRVFGIKVLLPPCGLALVIVGIAMAATQMEGYGNDKFCWLSVESGLFWSFVVPALAVILVNTVILALIIRKIWGLQNKSETEKAWTAFRSTCILLPVMGTTWVFGIFSINEQTIVFQYLFAILNSLQGLLIFIFHVLMDKKIQEQFKNTKHRYIPTTLHQTRSNPTEQTDVM